MSSIRICTLFIIVFWGSILLLAGCSPIPHNTRVEVYSLEEVREICSFFGHENAYECTQGYKGQYVIVTINDRDCMLHGLDHVKHGDWHPGRKASCQERAY
jgi:hypothetical protein